MELDPIFLSIDIYTLENLPEVYAKLYGANMVAEAMSMMGTNWKSSKCPTCGTWGEHIKLT